MTAPLSLVELSTAVGRDWVVDSLAGGYWVSQAVLALDPLARGSFCVIAPTSIRIQGSESLHAGRQISGPERAWPVLAGVLEETASRGAACVVLEDSVKGRGDPQAPFTSRSFLEDTVINWLDLAGAAGELAVNVIETSLPWMLNAFVSAKSSGTLGLVNGDEAGPSLGREIAESLMAIVVSAFDAESYVLWIAN